MEDTKLDDLTRLAPHMLVVMARMGLRAAMGSQGEATERVAKMLVKVDMERERNPASLHQTLMFKLWFKLGDDDYNVKYRRLNLDINVVQDINDLLDDAFTFTKQEAALLATIA